MPASISIARRFNGPPDSGNGGYTAGSIAAAIGENVTVRLVQPIPLERELTIADRGADRWEIRDGDALIAKASAHAVEVTPPVPPAYLFALEASKHYVGFAHHPFPTCFVCGTQRHRHDGLCIYPGALPGQNGVVAPWIPDETLDSGTGHVAAPFVWAALDCPGYFASVHPAPALLGELSVHIDRLVHIDEPCVVMSWEIARDDRKHRVGTALFGKDGSRCAVGVATWIELRKSGE